MVGSTRSYMNAGMPQYGSKGLPVGRPAVVPKELQQKVVDAFRCSPKGICETDLQKIIGSKSLNTMTMVLNSLLPRYLVYEESTGHRCIYFMEDQGTSRN